MGTRLLQALFFSFLPLLLSPINSSSLTRGNTLSNHKLEKHDRKA